MDFEFLRKRMVEEQLRPRGIKDEKVLAVFTKVARHKFVPKENINSSYADYPLPIGFGQTISQPFMVATMVENLKLTGGERVLEIGTGSGYQTAILSELAKEVYSVERIKELTQRAIVLLEELGYKNVKIKIGDGTLGWEEFSPFDDIIITAGTPEVPKVLLKQLKEKGKLILPLGDRFTQMLTLIEKIDDKVNMREICGCVFVPLIGKFGWKENARTS